MGKSLIGFRRVDHASWTVSELEPVIEFYTKVIGARLLYQMGPLDAEQMPRDAAGRDWTDTHLGIAMARFSLAMLEFSDGFKVELFQYERPVGTNAAPLSSNHVGSHHMGIEVEDLEQAAKVLIEHGCTVMERIEMDSGPTEGSSFRYFKDPWENIFELVEVRTTAPVPLTNSGEQP